MNHLDYILLFGIVTNIIGWIVTMCYQKSILELYKEIHWINKEMVEIYKEEKGMEK